MSKAEGRGGAGAPPVTAASTGASGLRGWTCLACVQELQNRASSGGLAPSTFPWSHKLSYSRDVCVPYPCLIRRCVAKSSARPWHRREAAEREGTQAGSVKQLQGRLCWLMPNRVWYHSCRTAGGGLAGPGSCWIGTTSSRRVLLPDF